MHANEGVKWKERGGGGEGKGGGGGGGGRGRGGWGDECSSPDKGVCIPLLGEKQRE